MRILQSLSSLTGKYFAVLVLLTAVIAFIFPSTFIGFGGYITILLGVVMFGMGLTLKPVDFKIIFTNPLPAIVGILSQYTIMPLIAFTLAYLLKLPPELAAGLVLLGSVPGGTASNVMVYLAKGNVALSVAMTSLSTLMAPVMTPLLLYFLAGQWLPVDPTAMFMSILQVIIIPIILGLIVQKFFPVIVAKGISVIPLISVLAILIIVSAVTAANADNVVTAGLLVFIAVFLHNSLGLLFGYIVASLMKLDENDRRAIAIEVGMQNSGLGVALATAHFSPLAALPSVWGAIWHNVSGPILATFWANKSTNTEEIKSKKLAPTKL